MSLTEADLEAIADKTTLVVLKAFETERIKTEEKIKEFIETHTLLCPYGKWFVNRKALLTGLVIGMAIPIAAIMAVVWKLLGK